MNRVKTSQRRLRVSTAPSSYPFTVRLLAAFVGEVAELLKFERALLDSDAGKALAASALDQWIYGTGTVRVVERAPGVYALEHVPVVP